MVVIMKIKLINRIINANINFTNKNFKSMGEYDQTKDIIVVDKYLSTDQKKLTLMHELIHAMDQGHTEIKYLDEKQIDALATEMLYFIRNNKRIINYLMKKV